MKTRDFRDHIDSLTSKSNDAIDAFFTYTESKKEADTATAHKDVAGLSAFGDKWAYHFNRRVFSYKLSRIGYDNLNETEKVIHHLDEIVSEANKTEEIKEEHPNFVANMSMMKLIYQFERDEIDPKVLVDGIKTYKKIRSNKGPAGNTIS